MSGKPTIRCAIYTRKSSEEGLDQAFNSLDAQRDACASYIDSQRHEGWKLAPERYDDGGVSGGTLDRPALQRLLADIAAGRIGMVVVYKIDRLTRSLADFAKLVERLDAAGCSFVSVTQAFNTSSSMGRLTLNVLLSFAQFEREVTAERIRDKIAASKKKGLWMGGMVPLGYDCDPDPTVRGLVVNPVEAGQVVELFTLYDELGTLSAVEAEGRRRGMTTKRHVFASGSSRGGSCLTRGMIHHVLTNPIYRGQIRHRDQLWPGQHPALVPEDLWTRVQAKLVAQSARPRGRRAASAAADIPTLTGKLRDETGDRLTPSHTQRNGRRISYYVSSRLLKAKTAGDQHCPRGWRLPARDLERTLAEAIASHLVNAAERQRVLVAPEAGSAASVEVAIHDVATKLRGGHGDLLRTLLVSGTLGESTVSLVLAGDRVAAELGVPPSAISPDSLRVHVPLTISRRGIELKVVAGPMTRKPDPALQRALARAHVWLADLKAGRSLAEIAQAGNHSESYVRTRLPLALLSPRIQRAILDGTQPAHLSVDAILRVDLPMDWRDQEQRLGLAE